jgi:hypothetical protein
MSHYQASDPDAYGYVLTERGQNMLRRALKKDTERRMKEAYIDYWRIARLKVGVGGQYAFLPLARVNRYAMIAAECSLAMRTTGDPLEGNFWARRGIYAKLLDDRWE